MRNLVPLDENPLCGFCSISTSKIDPTKATLRALFRDVEAAYEHYHAVRVRAKKPHSFDKAHRAALVSCYDSRTAALDALKGAIRQRQTDEHRATCQYCGIDTPKTFDHYLPKIGFEEYAVNSHNLVVCCYDCNSRRAKSAWSDTLHLYYETVDIKRTNLVASISDDSMPVVTYSLRIDDSIRSDLRYADHCRALSLCERYAVAAAGKLGLLRSEIVGLVQLIGSESLSALQQWYSDQADAAGLRLGRNNWEVALQRAVSESQHFIARCVQEASV